MPTDCHALAQRARTLRPVWAAWTCGTTARLARDVGRNLIEVHGEPVATRVRDGVYNRPYMRALHRVKAGI